MELKFRALKADEIECRISQITEKGLTLLLYKDARVDQNILDETVGPMNWQRHHSRENANCTVSIWDDDKRQWVEKEDTGTESYTEAEKGLASDSFKRACFNWGIGRELYTAPFIWIPAERCNIQQNSKGKLVCNDRFDVTFIAITDGKITGLEVANERTGAVVYRKAAPKKVEPAKEAPKAENEPKSALKRPKEELATQEQIEELMELARLAGSDPEQIYERANEITQRVYMAFKIQLEKRINAAKRTA